MSKGRRNKRTDYYPPNDFSLENYNRELIFLGELSIVILVLIYILYTTLNAQRSPGDNEQIPKGSTAIGNDYGYGGSISLVTSPDQLSGLESGDSAYELANYIYAQFGVKINISSEFFEKGKIQNEERLELMLEVLKEELAKYPKSLLEKCRVDRILISNVLAGKNAAFYLNNDSPHSGLIILTEKDSVPQGDFFRSTIHHEIYHACDFSENGYSDDNKIWEESFVCVNGPNCNPYNSPDHIESFVSSYAASTPVEDRAVVAENLLLAPKHAKYISAIETLPFPHNTNFNWKRDKVLGDYLRWSDGEMDQQYWEKMLLSSKLYSRNYNVSLNSSQMASLATKENQSVDYPNDFLIFTTPEDTVAFMHLPETISVTWQRQGYGSFRVEKSGVVYRFNNGVMTQIARLKVEDFPNWQDMILAAEALVNSLCDGGQLDAFDP